jgi:GGDEF domain-containing protein
MQLLAAMTSVMTTAAFHATASGQIMEANALFVQLMRCVPGDDWRKSVSQEDRTLLDAFWNAIFIEAESLHQPIAFHLHGVEDNYQVRAQAVTDETGAVVSAVGTVVVEATTSKRRWKTDPVTGLPEHDAAFERLEELSSNGKPFAAAVILLDPDDAGDDLRRKESARQLLSTVRPTDLIANTIDGRFLLCAAGVRSQDAALAMAERMTTALAGSSISARIGLVIPDHDAAVATLVREAEAGAYASEPGAYGFAPSD